MTSQPAEYTAQMRGTVDPAHVFRDGVPRDFAAEVAAQLMRRLDPGGAPTPKLRMGSVVSFDSTAWTATITVSGSTTQIPNVPSLTSHILDAGSPIIVLQFGTSYAIAGELGGPQDIQAARGLFNSNSDANTSAGNLPAVRIGPPSGLHMRIDGNEVIQMTNDTTQGTLVLNPGGAVKVGAGSVITALSMGTDAGTTDASSQVTFNHNLTKTPLAVVVTGRNSLQYQVFSISSTAVTLTCRTSAGALTGTGVATSVWFMAAA